MMTSTPTLQEVAPSRWLVAVEGIAAIIVGLLLLVAPGLSSVILVQLLGLYFLVGGIIGFVSLLWDRTEWGWKVARGILGILAGLVIIRHPLWSTLVIEGSLFFFLGAIAAAYGVVVLIRGFSESDWGLAILGVVDIAIGLVLLLNPFAGIVALPVLLGVLSLAGGIAAVVTALRMGARAPTEA